MSKQVERLQGKRRLICCVEPHIVLRWRKSFVAYSIYFFMLLKRKRERQIYELWHIPKRDLRHFSSRSGALLLIRGELHFFHPQWFVVQRSVSTDLNICNNIIVEDVSWSGHQSKTLGHCHFSASTGQISWRFLLIFLQRMIGFVVL